MKRLISFLTCIVLLLTVLTACGEKNREYNEEEVRLAAYSLLEDSKKVNLVFFGTGIRHDTESTAFSNGAYCIADLFHTNALGISNIAELKDETARVYTDALCSIIFTTKLSSLEDDGYILELARYYENDDGDIMVYTDAEPMYENEIEYLYDTLTVIGSKGELVYITVDAILTNADGKEQRKRAEFALLEEDDGWRLDTYSFIKFNESNS